MALLSRFTGTRIKSIQRGVITWSGSTAGNATITAINTTKYRLKFLGYDNSDGSISYAPRLSLTNSTTVTATRNSSAAVQSKVGFEVIEYY